MDRHAIFVDVGYVLAAAAELVTGTAERRSIVCDYPGLVEGLVRDIEAGTPLPLLRTYWYDASMTGNPEHEQQMVAALQAVRLRLGRLVRGEQKGVDSRIVRDLIVLAWDKAIAEAHLLAGDEDLCEGVQEAQDHGVRVVLLGVPGVNQSPLLVQQADAHRELPEDFWRRFVTPVVQPSVTYSTPAVLEVASNALPQEARPSLNPAVREALLAAAGRDQSGEFAALLSSVTEERDYENVAEEAGISFALDFAQSRSSSAMQDVLRWPASQVPPDVDRMLLRHADAYMEGRLWERPELKPAVRRGFKDECRRLAS